MRSKNATNGAKAMSKFYQRRKNNKYILPTAVYNQTIWCIRDFYRMQEEMDDILVETPAKEEGMPSSGALGNEVESKVFKRMPLFEKVRNIEEALKEIPEEYQKGVWDNVQHGTAYPLDAGRATYSRYKSKFIHSVAVRMGFIEKTTKN